MGHAKTRREVELPVCPECGAVGKNLGGGQLTFSCNGGRENPHKRTKMISKRFREVR